MSVLTEPPFSVRAANSGASGLDATGQDTMPAGAGNGQALDTGIRARLRRSTGRPRSSIHDPDLSLGLGLRSFPAGIQNSPGPVPPSSGASQTRSLSDRINRLSWPNPLAFATTDIASTSAVAHSLDFSSCSSFASTWSLQNRDSTHCWQVRANPNSNPSSLQEPHQPSQSQPMLFTHSASFSSPAPPAGLSATSSSTTTTTTTTPAGTSPPSESASRRGLRRLSHLRSYNPSHLLSRESNSSSSGGEGISRSASDFNNVAAVPRSPQHVAGTTSRAANRLTLVDSVHVPSRATAANDNSANNNNANGRSHHATNGAQSCTRGQTSASPATSNPEQESYTARETTRPSPQVDSDSHANLQPQPQPAMTRTRSSTTGDVAGAGAAATAAPTAADFLPSLRLTAYYDPRSTRPSLTFPAISRTLPTGTESIRVGRYSERDSQSMANVPGNQPSAAPVGFKSKVVSRRHCEFWYENGKWYIKDVKSSSGTFLNHIRLSPPSQESKAFVVGDGDIVQLGIDFKGGEEMIFRCVKMRVELNRGWQNKLNTFNMAAHKRLRTMAKTSGTPAEKAGSSSQDCSICLNMIAPCQSLFVAPCSHTWHFKCVRSLLSTPQYPIFICPNCRAGCDLEADVDDPAEDWEQLDAEGENADKASINGAPLANPAVAAMADISMEDSDAMDTTVALGATDGPGNLPHATSEPLPIRNPAPGTRHTSDDHRVTPSPPHANEGPITPRNEVGPWVFDGGAGQRPREQDQPARMTSLDAAAESLDGLAAAGSAHLPNDSSEGSIR